MSATAAMPPFVNPTARPTLRRVVVAPKLRAAAPAALASVDDSVEASANAHIADEPPRCTSHDILQGHAEVQIEHFGSLYRLRVTSLGKLILTK